MLYPDLRQLSLARACATGGTHDAEAGGSKDPPPPKRGTGSGGNSPAYEDPVEAAFAVPDIVRMMLEQVASGQEAVDACRDFVSMCASSNAFGPVCNDDATWTAMTKRVFPKIRAPNPDLWEPTEPKKWFAFLCQQHVVAERLADELFAIRERENGPERPSLQELERRYQDEPSWQNRVTLFSAQRRQREGKDPHYTSQEWSDKYREWERQQRLMLDLMGKKLLKPKGTQLAYSKKPHRREMQVLMWFWLPRAMARARERATRNVADGAE